MPFSGPSFVDQLLELKTRIRELEAGNAALRQRCSGLVCFSCGDDWSIEKDCEKCDQAHRENWTHEWVSPRVVLLTKEIVALHQRTEAAERKLAASAVVDDMIHASDVSEYRELRQRAEAAERDYAAVEVFLRDNPHALGTKLKKAEAERDAALASVAVMRKALEECQNDPRVEYRTRHMVDAALASDTGKT